jgi:hypothetical protein
MYLPYSRELLAHDGYLWTELRDMAACAARDELICKNPVVDFLPAEARRKMVPDTVRYYRTQLVFPTVASHGIWMTELTIVNRSSGLTGGPQHARSGSATLTLFPVRDDGLRGTPSQWTTNTIPAGVAEHLCLDATVFAHQNGHIAANCRFPASGCCRLYERSPGGGVRLVSLYTADIVSEKA